MNWAALRHLCWVLLLLDVVSGGEEDQSSRPTTPVRLRRPIRRNSIKKSSEDDFKPSIFPDDPSSTTGSTRFTTKRTSAVDYLARNTVPVASVTETSRKPYRPPPAHLLTYQALSSTEKGSGQTNEPNLSPTGWAVASLGPPKNSSLVTKKSNTPLGTTRPLTSYWSTRLRRPPSLRTSPIPPIGNEDQRSSEEGGGAAVAIPSDNLIKYDSNATASHPKLHNDFPGAAKDTTLGPASSQKDNVLEKPLNAKKPDITTPSQIFQVTTDNTRNNLIKELRGGDIGSKILHGIVAVTNASQYSDEVVDQHKDDGNGGSSTQKVESIDSHTPQDDTNVVDESVKLVTRKSEHGAMSSVTNDPLMHNTTDVTTEGSSKEHASTHFNISEAPSATTRDPLETRPMTIARFSKESLQVTTESSKETFSTAAATFPTMTSRSDSQESSQESGTSAVSSEDYELSSELPTDRQMLPDRSVSFTKSADSKEMELNETTPSQPTTGFPVPKSSISMSDVSTPVSIITETDTTITTSIPEGSILPVIANMTSQLDRSSNENASVPHFFTTAASAHENVTATTVSQEVNDIPEAYTRVKNNPEKSASEGSSEVSFPTSTTTIAKSTPRQETRRPSTYKTTTTFSTTESSGSTKTTTEIPVASIPTSTQSIQETTTVVVKDTRPEFETEAATTWEVIPATDKSKEEVTSRSSIDVPTTTPMIQFKTTVSSHVPTKPIMESAETTTAHYGQGVSHGVSTTEYVHIGLSEKPEDDHDDTLKYNVTTIDHPHNGTETDESEEEPDDETERDGDVHTTTTLVIIEEITTPKSTTGSTNIPTHSSTEQPSSTSTRGKIDDDERSATADKTSESSEPRLRLTFEASFKEMCLVRDSLAETIASYFKSVSSRSIQPNQVKILNLGMAECSSKSLPLMEKVPVFVQITNAEGKGDHNLTDILYSYIKQNPFNFKYQLAHVEHGQKPLVMEEDNQWGGTVIAAIVISSVAGVSLLCLTILLVIMRKRQKGFTYGQRCTPVSLEDYSLDNISVFNSVRRKAMRASKRSYGNPAFDDPVTVTNPLNFVGLSNMANSHQKIDNEYSEVPTVTVKPDELPPGAEHKNRYANVIPIPETRVPLKGPDGEDMFINANYVKGVKGAAKFYIACQAPLESTIADFWTMVWEQQSQVILMLTDLHENGVEKSADYLPPSEVLDCHRVFGDLQVTLKKREVREKYIISSLQLRNLESNLWREVIHLWYTGWPIRGVPEDLPSIIAYLIEARSYSKPGHPIVVHCSPGTGRTGTVIAIDIAIRDFETDRTVDIPKTVYGIRRDRAGAVQTNLQYYMIYQVIHLYATKLTGGSLDSI